VFQFNINLLMILLT